MMCSMIMSVHVGPYCGGLFLLVRCKKFIAAQMEHLAIHGCGRILPCGVCFTIEPMMFELVTSFLNLPHLKASSACERGTGIW